MKRVFQSQIFRLGLALVVGVFVGLLIFQGDRVEDHPPVVEAGEKTIWTCAMHPQIRLNEPGECPICGMDLIPVGRRQQQGSEASPFVHTMSQEATALANVQTSTVMYATPEYRIDLTGKIAVNEQKRWVITANYSGRIESLFVDFTGQEVKKGEKLATIYSPELVTAQKELLEAAKYKHVYPTLYRAAKEKLRLWKIAERQIDAIEATGKIRTDFDVYADFSGVVLARRVSTGDYVSKGSVLFEVADLRTVWVLVDAYESDLSWMKSGTKIYFTVASVPGKEFTSTVTFIDPVINPQTRTASVRAEAHNTGLELKPEMFVNARLQIVGASHEKALLVPRSAVLWTGVRSVVYVKVPDSEFPAFEMREFGLGPRAGEFYIVEDGLKAGEEVVANGVFAVDAAAQLSGKYSMMNRKEVHSSGSPRDEPLEIQQTHRH